MTYKGRCPVCSAQLIVEELYVVCERNDYKVSIIKFEVLWEEFEKAQLSLTEKLLSDLQSYNLLDVQKQEENP